MRIANNAILPDPPEVLWRDSPRRHDLAYAYLKRLLLSGGLDPGDQISSEAVGRALSVSRAPVTDAIRRLTVEGLLEVLPQVGCRVVRPAPNDVADFFAVFGATEGTIARFAAERRSPAEAAAFQIRCAALADNTGLPDDPGERFVELRQRNRLRYKELHALARSPLSIGIGETFWDRSDFFLRIAFGVRRLPDYVRAGHAAMIGAVVSGDGDAAERETQDYLVRLGQDTANQLRRVA